MRRVWWIVQLVAWTLYMGPVCFALLPLLFPFVLELQYWDHKVHTTLTPASKAYESIHLNAVGYGDTHERVEGYVVNLSLINLDGHEHRVQVVPAHADDPVSQFRGKDGVVFSNQVKDPSAYVAWFERIGLAPYPRAREEAAILAQIATQFERSDALEPQTYVDWLDSIGVDASHVIVDHYPYSATRTEPSRATPQASRDVAPPPLTATWHVHWFEEYYNHVFSYTRAWPLWGATFLIWLVGMVAWIRIRPRTATRSALTRVASPGRDSNPPGRYKKPTSIWTILCRRLSRLLGAFSCLLALLVVMATIIFWRYPGNYPLVLAVLIGVVLSLVAVCLNPRMDHWSRLGLIGNLTWLLVLDFNVVPLVLGGAFWIAP